MANYRLSEKWRNLYKGDWMRIRVRYRSGMINLILVFQSLDLPLDILEYVLEYILPGQLFDQEFITTNIINNRSFYKKISKKKDNLLDLQGIILKDVTIKGNNPNLGLLSLTNIDFSYSNFEGVSFEGMKLCSNLTGSLFKKCQFSYVYIWNICLKNISLEGCSFAKTTICHTVCINCELFDIRFCGCKIVNTAFHYSDVSYINICCGRFDRLQFNKCQINELSMENNTIGENGPTFEDCYMENVYDKGNRRIVDPLYFF